MKKNKELARKCENCVKGYSITINGDILCSIKGIVSPDYFCGKHRFSPETNSYNKKRHKCIDCQNFMINYNSGESGIHEIGLCQLFSVREFNGSEKNACSKFIKRSASSVKIQYDKAHEMHL